MAKTHVKLTHHGRYSSGGAALAKALGIKRVIPDDTVLGEANTLINWGYTKLHPRLAAAGRIINSPDHVYLTSNKTRFFEHMAAAPLLSPRIPEFTTDKDQAIAWVQSGQEVLGRAVTNGKGGEGIIFGSDENTFEDFIDCPLFVKYKKKKDEYRVHILFGEITDVQQKLLRIQDDNGNPIDPQRVDYRVRNVANGFIFARNGVHPPADVIEQATRAYKISGLDFGAMDVIYNRGEERAYVLEINTAPGLMGTTLENYTKKFKQVLDI